MERSTKRKDFKKPYDDDMISNNSDDESYEQKSFQIIREENNPSTEMISEIFNRNNYFGQEESSEESNNNNIYSIYNYDIEQIEKKEQLSLNKTTIVDKNKIYDAANDDLKVKNFLNKKEKLSKKERVSYIFNNEIPTKKKKVTKIEIENSKPKKFKNSKITEEKNKDNIVENLKTQIFNVLPKIFSKKEFDKKFMDNLKNYSWENYLGNPKTIELEENLEKDKEFFGLLKESPWTTFKRIFKRAKDVDQDFKYKIGKRTIDKFSQLINFFLSQKEKKNDAKVYNGKNYDSFNNNEKSDDMLELNNI